MSKNTIPNLFSLCRIEKERKREREGRKRKEATLSSRYLMTYSNRSLLTSENVPEDIFSILLAVRFLIV